MSTATNNNYEDLVYRLIKDSGSSGITQQEILKRTGISSRDLTIILKRLIEKNKVQKKSVKENGKSKVKYFPNTNNLIEIYVKLDIVQETPCFNCKYLYKCGNGTHISPSNCSKFYSWILREIGSA
ncbi:MAG: winged helix-turn-helix domain-containing protein [Sulfolobaceae archaeon]